MADVFLFKSNSHTNEANLLFITSTKEAVVSRLTGGWLVC